MAEASLPRRWVCRTGTPRRDGAAAAAAAAARVAAEAGEQVDLDVVDAEADLALARRDLLVALGDDPLDVDEWWPAVQAGVPVLLPAVPGVADAVREAVALGAAVVVEDPEDSGAVLAAARTVAAASAEDRAVAGRVLALRASGVEVDTRPRVLAVAFSPRDLAAARQACRLATALGGRSHLVVARPALRGAALPPVTEATSVTVVDDPTAGSALARLERLALLRLPRLAVRLLAAAPVVRRHTGRAERVAAVLERAHSRGWVPLAARVRPWLLARRVAATSPPELAGDVDVVVAPGADAQALVWRLLRAFPEVESRGSLNYHGVREVVRRRARAGQGEVATYTVLDDSEPV